MRRRDGFTLIELMIALVMTGVVVGAVYQMLLTNQRVYRQQTERVDLNGNLRAVVSVLPTELRELSATDAMGSDLLAIRDTALAYKGMRGAYVLCLDPVITGPSTGTLVLWRDLSFGLRGIDPDRDSLVVYAENDLGTRHDNMWVHMNAAAAPTAGTACAGQPSLSVPVTDVSPANALVGIRAGAPVRTYELAEVLTYADVNGDWWLGGRRYSKGGGWGAIQPMLGPLAAAGVRFQYFDAAGVVTAVPAEVARIGVTVIGRTDAAVSRGGSGIQEYLLDTLVTHIALRNNRR